MDFNKSKNNYRTIIEKSIRFAGKEHDFFVKVKADFLKFAVNQVMPNFQRLRLLDIGCGHGFIHNQLQRDGFDVIGVDVAEEVLTFAKQANPNVSYLSYNGSKLPFENDSFDVALAICVMHHVEPSQWEDFLIEMWRILKPGGIGIVFEHNPYNPLTRYVVSRNILDHDAVLLSAPKLKNLMKRSGFHTVKNRYILFTPFVSPIFRWLDKRLGYCALGAQYYTLGTKSKI